MGVLTRPTVADRLRATLTELPPAERRVARALLGGYPVIGLEPLARVALEASTSAPTVLRLVNRLGFAGYPQFQRQLRSELASRVVAPAGATPGEPRAAAVGAAAVGPASSGGCDPVSGPAGEAAAAAEWVARAVTDDVRRLAETGELDGVADLLADPRRSVWTVGGGVGGVPADYLGLHLQRLRARVHRVPADPADLRAAALELDRRAVVVAFDYGRYHAETAEFARHGAIRGAAVVGFTDQWRSPLAGRSEHVVVTTAEADGALAVLSPTLAALDVLLAVLTDRLGRGGRERARRYDALAFAGEGCDPARTDDDPATAEGARP